MIDQNMPTLSELELLIDNFNNRIDKKLFDGFNIAEPAIECKICNKSMIRFCTRLDCSECSLCCENENCQGYNAHSICKSVRVSTVTNLLKMNLDGNKEFVIQMIKIEEDLLKELAVQREELIKSTPLCNLEDRFQKIVQQIYKKKNKDYLKGKQADEFFNKLVALSKIKNNP